jgi:hypothetical protein
MKNIGKTVFKPFVAEQKRLFDCKEVLTEHVVLKDKDGMPNWFWKLAQECHAELTRC